MFDNLQDKSQQTNEAQDDLEDLMILRAAKKEDIGKPSIPLEKLKEGLSLRDSSI